MNPLSPPAASHRFYYGWIVLVVGALSMVATFPGRSLGRGLITEPLLSDLRLDRVEFGWITFGATLIGSAFSIGCGPLIDRLGTRLVLTANAALLGIVVLATSRVESSIMLAVTLTLTLGLGQSALSVVSLATVGKWFARRIDIAMAVYAAIVSVGFIVAFVSLGSAVQSYGWRATWAGIGWTLLIGVAPVAFLMVRRTPESIGLLVDGDQARDEVKVPVAVAVVEPTGATLAQAIRTYAFWVFALSSAAFTLIFTGVTTFAETIVRERGFYDQATFMTTGAVLAGGGLIANFVGGLLARRMPHGRLMSIGMLIVTAALLILPFSRSSAGLLTYGALMGIAGGIVTVVFFSCWSKRFGRAHLGAIQGAAQVLTVLASSLGPVLLAIGERQQGAISKTFLIFAPIVAGLAIACWFVPRQPDESPPFRN